MLGCTKNSEENSEICKMFLRRKLYVCALMQINLKGKCEGMFHELLGRVPDVGGGRAREGVTLLLSM